MHLLGAAPRVVALNEPGIGVHLAPTLGSSLSMHATSVPIDRLRLNDVRTEDEDYFFNERYADAWREPLRDLILARLRAQVVDRCRRDGIPDPVVVVKEPHGSQAADLLLSLFPASRMVFLLRDGRDVLDSELDAGSAGSWASWATEGFRTADEDRTAFLADRAHVWALRTHVVQSAHDAHPAHLRRRVRYEDMLADTVVHLRDLDDWLDLGLGDAVAEVAHAGSVAQQPAEVRGQGRFVRSATPGGWQETFTPDEVAMVDAIMGETLRQQGYA